MIVTYKNIDKVTFPCFTLPSSNWHSVDGLLFLDNVLLDDRNMKGETLGTRRVQTPFTELVPLKDSIISHTGIIKQSKNCFIDSKGMPFIYEKTRMCALKYYRIRKVELKEIAALLWVKDIRHPFTIPRPPESSNTWAGILHLGKLPWKLYEYSDHKKKDTRRKI